MGNIRLSDQAKLEFFENEAPGVTTRRFLSFRAPAVMTNGAELVLPVDNSADGVLTKLGTVLSWGNVSADIAAAIATHEAASDPHTGYQKESEKNQASGYAGLTAGSKITASQIQEVIASTDLTDDSALEYKANKDAVSGYAGLDASTLVLANKLGTGTPGSTNFLRGDRTWQVLTPAGGGGALDWGSMRQAGTSPLECWYIAGIDNANTLGAGGTAPTADVMFAFPYLPGRGGTLDRIQFEITTVGGANSKMRVGIYKATSLTNLYPSALLVDGGEQATNSGALKTSTISTILPTDRLLWFVVLATGGGGSVATIRNVAAVTNSPQVFGYTSALGASAVARTGLSVSQTYGALPDPFTAGGTLFGTGASPYGANVPVIAVRYSA